MPVLNIKKETCAILVLTTIISSQECKHRLNLIIVIQKKDKLGHCILKLLQDKHIRTFIPDNDCINTILFGITMKKNKMKN